ncbi:MAG TPA: cell wall hydrolase [Halanaerobiaceae bacterium]|jgi:N-acetylmuramoyl-L-alanine amidase|nr:cell wall hydrolase [Bacillota bacterium]HHU92844.1 cell wall hydrolase [Halanaerobiaceae bacterium]HOA40673.1 cell wall hydrolase [Halanaerobiales bacterium]HPZ63438.1 cell wall hydrolase [Halanaerobiales bacterium]HQD04675.1 cell wall hydrolase [Halanaerobiales bacterium]
MNKGKLFPLTIVLLLIIVLSINAAESYNLVLGERVLRKGDEGADVAILQRKLKEIGIYKGGIDGIFGAGTEEAVRNLQKKYKLTVDGIVGEKTINVLPADNLISRMDVSREEIIQLAYLINGEARGESFRGKVAVGAVVLNRVKSPGFPNTIREVILQEGQFSCILDGQANLYPSQSCIEAAKAAILGYDPTGGALFFYNPRIATNVEWISKRPVITRIGDHVFAK